jgi:hypothetical protein
MHAPYRSSYRRCRSARCIRKHLFFINHFYYAHANTVVCKALHTCSHYCCCTVLIATTTYLVFILFFSRFLHLFLTQYRTIYAVRRQTLSRPEACHRRSLSSLLSKTADTRTTEEIARHTYPVGTCGRTPRSRRCHVLLLLFFSYVFGRLVSHPIREWEIRSGRRC